jgi:regulator of replication initiation timing
MDLPLVATASSVLGTALTAMKYVREVSDSTDDLELKSRINDLYTAMVDVKDRVMDLSEENRRLKEELARKDEIVGPEGPKGYFFLKSKPDNPLCPKCLQSKDRNRVFLEPQEFYGGPGYHCIICNLFIDK